MCYKNYYCFETFVSEHFHFKYGQNVIVNPNVGPKMQNNYLSVLIEPLNGLFDSGVDGFLLFVVEFSSEALVRVISELVLEAVGILFELVLKKALANRTEKFDEI